MIFTILTLFPDIFHSPLQESIIKKAFDKGLVSFNIINIRDFAADVNKTCDDRPYGGGPGMVMKPEPFFEAVEAIADPEQAHVVLLTPQGRSFDQTVARSLSQRVQLVLLCGHYEGVDERVATLAHEQISLGDFVLTGAELPALVVTDAVVRLLPGVLGNEASPLDESFSGLLEYPQYTRPPEYRGLRAPEVLTGGHHAQVRRWRRREALRRTLERRPDLLATAELNEEDWRLLRELQAAED